MPTDLTVILQHRPGELARLGEVIGETGARIRGLAAFTGEGRGVAHVLLDDQAVARCRAALQRAGMGIADQGEVLTRRIPDHPEPGAGSGATSARSHAFGANTARSFCAPEC